LATVAEIRAAGGKATEQVADVREEDDVARAVASCAAQLGAVHVGVNCAGVEADTQSIEHFGAQEYERIFRTHVYGAALFMKYVIPRLVQAGGGALVNTASTGGVVGFPGAPLYCAAKHAVVGLTKVGALDHARFGVRVNCVAPSAVDTPMLSRFTGGDDSMLGALANAHPLRRIASAREVAEAIVWLASPRSSYVTGHTLMVDGGYTVG
ncbi:MAG: SDR family oxidoreductase, partial [Polyangiaceae bacterium]|nr:SDR family oxidoreductase [Polyangiaceae bacterium]